MLVLIVSALVLTTGSVVQSLKLPESFPLCHQSDPKFFDCLVPAVTKALRELKHGNKAFKLLALDPLEITKIVFSQGNGPVSLNLDLLNSKTTGLTDAFIKTTTVVEKPPGKYKLFANGVIPRLNMDADYVIDGKFLILPLKGKGKCNLTIINVEADVDITGDQWNKDGKIYMKVTEFKATITKIDRFYVNFENLFNGDKTLGESTNALLNDNWPEFWGELKAPFEETFSQVLEVFAAKMFHNVPYNEIFLD